MLHISHLPVPKSGMIKLPFRFFLCPGNVIFLVKNCMCKWGGKQCDWGVRNPSWQQQTGITNHAKQIPERGRGICIRMLIFFDIYTKWQLWQGTQKSSVSVSFSLFFQYGCELHRLHAELNYSFSQAFLQFCFTSLLYVNCALSSSLLYLPLAIRIKVIQLSL